MSQAAVLAKPARALDRLIAPRSVALIGASPDAGKLPGRPLAYFRRYGFKGTVHPVNPKYAEIDGVRCYPAIDALPDGVDLALILLPAKAVPEALEACGRRGIPFAISIAGGFAEAGAPERQAELIAICRRHGIRLVGPNCVGLLNPRRGVTATFSTVLKTKMPRPGPLALITQSGALGNSLLQSFNDLDVGLAAWVSTGNEADLDVLELAEHFIDDDDVRTIALFIEGLKDGARLQAIAGEARARGKAIVALRGGRSALGRSASISHTGKLAGSNAVWRDLARQAGVIEVGALDELLDAVRALEILGDPRDDAADGLGVLTISGGLGVLISDAAAEVALPLPRFADATQAALRGVLPPQMTVANPVDTALFTDERGFAACAEAVLADPKIGTLLLVLTSLAHDYRALTPWLAKLAGEARARAKHLAVTYLSSSDQLDAGQRQAVQDAGALVLPTAERIVAALGRRRRLADFSGASPAPLHRADGGRTADEFFARVKLPRPAEQICVTLDEAREFAVAHGYPVALKIESADIPHKTEAGGVVLGIADGDALARAWAQIAASVKATMPTARIEGMRIQEMAQGFELIAGCSVDPEMGRVVMVGAGGIWAEILGDAAFLALPVGIEDIKAAIGRLKIAPILAGARGRPPLDIDAAAAVIARLGAAFAAETWVREVDINPLIVRPSGVVAVDTLLVPEPPSNGHSP